MTSEDLTTKLAKEAEPESREMTDEELEGIAGGQMPRSWSFICERCNIIFAYNSDTPLFTTCSKCGDPLTPYNEWD